MDEFIQKIIIAVIFGVGAIFTRPGSRYNPIINWMVLFASVWLVFLQTHPFFKAVSVTAAVFFTLTIIVEVFFPSRQSRGGGL